METPEGAGAPNPVSTTWMWIVLVIIVVMVSGGIYFFAQGQDANSNTTNVAGAINTNQNSNRNTGIVTNSDTPGWKKYSYVDQGIAFAAPATVGVQERLGETQVIDGRTYPDFTLVITDPSVVGELVFSSRETGFEADTVTAENTAELGGKSVRIVASERSAGGEVARFKRYFFYPLNSGTIYEVYWISYPVDSAAQQAFFETIVQSLEFLK